MNPVNYRSIALLNSVYKKIATHANRELLAAAIEHSIIHPTQFGGLPNRRCQDHIFNLLSTFPESADSYSLYIHINNAFNSVPHTTLFTVLSRLNFPTPLVSLIQSLYAPPATSRWSQGTPTPPTCKPEVFGRDAPCHQSFSAFT